jgi:hypothetical protein
MNLMRQGLALPSAQASPRPVHDVRLIRKPSTQPLTSCLPQQRNGLASDPTLEATSSSDNGAYMGRNGRRAAPKNYGALEKKDYEKFVQFFRQASPYIEGHRGRTFVLIIPGEVRGVWTGFLFPFLASNLASARLCKPHI